MYRCLKATQAAYIVVVRAEASLSLESDNATHTCTHTCCI